MVASHRAAANNWLLGTSCEMSGYNVSRWMGMSSNQPAFCELTHSPLRPSTRRPHGREQQNVDADRWRRHTCRNGNDELSCGRLSLIGSHDEFEHDGPIVKGATFWDLILHVNANYLSSYEK
jgi:hypothetical protein